MAKALLGYIGGPDPRLLVELAQLRRRVLELEPELERVRTEIDALVAARNSDGLLGVVA